MSEESQSLSFTYNIQGKPLEVMVGGEIEFVSEIEFTAPTSRNMKESSQLKQMLTRAMQEMQSKVADISEDVKAEVIAAQKESDAGIDGEMIIAALTASTVPLDEVLSIGYKLLVSGVGKVAGQKFSANMAEKLSLEELERMVGEYAVNFPLKSLLN